MICPSRPNSDISQVKFCRSSPFLGVTIYQRAYAHHTVQRAGFADSHPVFTTFARTTVLFPCPCHSKVRSHVQGSLAREQSSEHSGSASCPCLRDAGVCCLLQTCTSVWFPDLSMVPVRQALSRIVAGGHVPAGLKEFSGILKEESVPTVPSHLPPPLVEARSLRKWQRNQERWKLSCVERMLAAPRI